MWETLKSRATFVVEVLVEAAREFGVDRAGRMGAAIAYRTVFALAPLLIIAVAILGAVIGSSDEAQQEVIVGIEQIAGEEVAEFLIDILESAVVSSDTAAIVGGLLLFWTASSLFLEMQHDLNDIFHVPYEHLVGVVALVRKRGIGFLWAFGLGLTMIAVWMLNFMWRFLEGLFADLPGVHRIIGVLTPLISALLLPIIFALIFQTMTVSTVRWRAVWWGGFFTSAVFILAAYGIGIYFAWNRTPTAVGVAGSFFVVLFLAYLLANVFLFGAEVTKVYHDYLVEGDIKSPTYRAATAPGPTEVVVAEPVEPVPVAAVLGFLGGLFVGWRRRRR